jgi:hypothetical protein
MHAWICTYTTSEGREYNYSKTEAYKLKYRSI